jgi:hypothetical protein
MNKLEVNNNIPMTTIFYQRYFFDIFISILK